MKTNSRPIPATRLWTLGSWRCEIDRSNRLRLFHGETLVAEHRSWSLGSAQAYAQVWQAAIADLPTVADGPRSV